MKADLALKRGKFVGKVHSLMQEFHFARKDVLMKLINTYTTSFYGSPLWDPLSTDCDRLYRCWNVTIRNIFSVDRKTHRFLIEPLSESLHPKVMLLSRMVGFYKAQLESPKMSIRFLIKLAESDQRTILGNTLEHIRSKCGLKQNELSRLTPSMVRKQFRYMPIPFSEQWRVPLMQELLQARNCMDLPGFTSSEIDDMLTSVCCD